MATPAAPHLEPLHLEALPNGRFAVTNVGDAATHNVVFGGQLLAQSIMAAGAADPDKTVKTINMLFPRAGRIDADTELEVDTFHAGRAFASHTITAWQGDRLCARASVLTHVAEPDMIAHQLDRPSARPPDESAIARDHAVFPGGEYVVVDGVDLMNSDAPVGPAELSVWYRYPDAPADDQLVNQAALAWGTDGFLIGTAMRPHEGVAYDRAHVDLATGVVGHTLTFHRPFDLRNWALMTHTSPFAGGGRTYGQCHIHDADGTLIASCVQDNMVRAMPS